MLDPNDENDASPHKPKTPVSVDSVGENIAFDQMDVIGPTDSVREMLENVLLDEEDPHSDENEVQRHENEDDPQPIEEVIAPSSAPRRSGRQRKAPELAEGIIAYNSNSRKMLGIGSDEGVANLAWIENKFAYRKFILKCYEHMTRILTTLATKGGQIKAENELPDEPCSLEDAMRRPDWPEWEAAMKREFDSPEENKT
jgi:hypothetical protein